MLHFSLLPQGVPPNLLEGLVTWAMALGISFSNSACVGPWKSSGHHPGICPFFISDYCFIFEEAALRLPLLAQIKSDPSIVREATGG